MSCHKEDKYTKEFKIEAVRMANTPGVTLKQMVRNSESIHIYQGNGASNFKLKGKLGAFPGQGNPRDEERAALKRELVRVKKDGFFKRSGGVR